MKKIMLAIVIIFLAGCTATSNAQTVNLQDQILSKNIHEAKLQVNDMTCTSCALGVEYQLKQIDGVIDAKISYENGTGYVKYDANKVSPETIAQASDVYPASVIEDKKI